jgi:hypothetical protein
MPVLDFPSVPTGTERNIQHWSRVNLITKIIKHRTARIPPPYLSFTLRILISEASAFSSLTCHESSLPKGQNSLFLSLNKVTNPNFKTNPFISQMGSKRLSHLDDPPTASSSEEEEEEEEEETSYEEEETSSEEEEAAPKISSLPSTPVTDKKPRPSSSPPFFFFFFIYMGSCRSELFLTYCKWK